jgi:hypothetical protein
MRDNWLEKSNYNKFVTRARSNQFLWDTVAYLKKFRSVGASRNLKSFDYCETHPYPFQV